MSQRFFVGNKQYDIPDDVRDAFLKANPNAIPGIEYDVDGKKYSIPASIKDYLFKNILMLCLVDNQR